MLNTIIKLIDAGYTKDEIRQMMNADEMKEKPAPEEKKERPAPEPKKEEPAPEPAPEQKRDPEPFDTEPFTKAVNEMSKAMDAMNIKLQKMALSMYEQPEAKTKTVESIIAHIVDPDA